jgi:CMP-N,N'-diacetyllegionaminic acid synthase
MGKVLAVIPARGGSKGVPNKNIRLLAGKPLIEYSIASAIESRVVDRVVVSTDSKVIAETAARAGALVVSRPAEISGDDSLVTDAIRHVVGQIEAMGEEYEFILLLEPTSPLRSPEDIQKAVQLLRSPGIDSVASFSETKTPPARIWRIENGNVQPFIPGSNAFLPRQKLEKGYYINGIIYGFKTSDLKKNPGTASLFFGRTAPIIVENERIIDIDSEMDFTVAEVLLKNK